MAKNITTDKETREKMLEGILALASTVGSTLGPMGRNVVIETPYGATTVTKDGVTVAKHFDVSDPVQNLGVQIIKQAAARTAALAGDGTTSSTVIAAALVKEANKLIAAGVPPITIKRGLDYLLQKAIEKLEENSLPVDATKIKQIATISANNDEEIGELISKAYEIVGPQGLITLEDSKTGVTSLEYTEGVSFDKGYVSPFFVTDASKGEAVLENPLIFITDQKLRYSPEIVPLLEIAATNNRPMLIIADEVEGQALQLCVVNKMRGIISIAAVPAPSFGESRLEQLKDIAALTSSTIYSKGDASRIEHVSVKDLGTAERVIISKNKTVFVGPKSDTELVKKRADEISTQLTGENDQYQQQKLKRRLADLTAKVAVIKVGAATETELKEKKDRVDDALRATSCALQKGYLPGGGSALLKLSETLTYHDLFVEQLFRKALTQPLRQIAENAGEAPEVVVHNVKYNTDPKFGFNAYTGEYVDMVAEGIIDPTIVVEQALRNAVSAASMVILSSSSLTNVDRTPPYSPGNIEDYAAQ